MIEEQKQSAKSIIGMKCVRLVKRFSSFGYMDQEIDFNSLDHVQLAIQSDEDNRYFDKYGNEFSIEEIEK
jgi:hypothetical protein